MVTVVVIEVGLRLSLLQHVVHTVLQVLHGLEWWQKLVALRWHRWLLALLIKLCQIKWSDIGQRVQWLHPCLSTLKRPNLVDKLGYFLAI